MAIPQRRFWWQIIPCTLRNNLTGIRQQHLARTYPGRVIGSTSYLDFQGRDRALEIGWTWLTPAYWRTVVNTQCKYLLLQHAFEALGMYLVQLMTDSRNQRSQRAIERLGAQKEGVLRSHILCPDGYRRDSVFYSILDHKWPGVRHRLEAALHRA